MEGAQALFLPREHSLVPIPLVQRVLPWFGFRVGHRGFAMGIEVRVCLIDLKRAFRRLLARLPDEFEAGGDFIDLNVSEKTLARRLWRSGSAEHSKF